MSKETVKSKKSKKSDKSATRSRGEQSKEKVSERKSKAETGSSKASEKKRSITEPALKQKTETLPLKEHEGYDNASGPAKAAYVHPTAPRMPSPQKQKSVGENNDIHQVVETSVEQSKTMDEQQPGYYESTESPFRAQ